MPWRPMQPAPEENPARSMCPLRSRAKQRSSSTIKISCARHSALLSYARHPAGNSGACARLQDIF